MGTGQQRKRTATLPEERRRVILDQIDRQPIVRAEDLAARLGASIETVRRDLLALEQQGLTRRVYGGVTRPRAHPVEPPFEQRRLTRAPQKRAMAQLAISLVTPGTTLILDIGTSVAEIARQLPATYRGRILTNSLLVAFELAGREGIELLVSGGRVRGGDLACFGPHAEALFGGFYGGIAFLGSGALHPVIGLTDHYIDEIPSRRLILEHADEVYVMADSSKLGQIAPAKVCDLAALTAIITDDGVDGELEQAFGDAGVRLLIAPTLPSDDAAVEGVRMA